MRLCAALLSSALALGCGSDPGAKVAGDPSTAPSDGDVATTIQPETVSDGEVPDPVLARRTIGPAGGSIATPDGTIELVVPAGALAADTELRLVGPREPPELGRLLSEVVDLEPAGLVFQLPARIVFAVPTPGDQAAVFWTDGTDRNHFQQLPTRLTGGTASAPIVHFSTVFLGDPTVPGPAGWFCCTPKDPNAHTDADCIAWSAGSGTTCDPAICDAVAGACPTDPPMPGCCSPGPTGDEPTQGCQALMTFGQCALGIGAGWCDWSATCATATPGCCSAVDPQHDNATIPCALLGTHAGCTQAPACQWNASSACPVPTPGQPPCADCQDPTYTNSPAFITSAQAAWQLFGNQSCTALGGSPVPVPTSTPGDPGYATELGRFCAYDAALGAHGCTGATAPSCPGLPTACCVATGSAQPLGTSCEVLKSESDCTLTTGAGFCAWNPVCGTASPPGCCEAIDPAHDHPGLPCAQMPGYDECVTSLGLGICQWNGGGNCQAVDPCADCVDPSLLNDPDFQSAQQSWLANHTSPTCGSLAASPQPAPTQASGTVAWKNELGPWCAYQQSLVGLGCTSPAPTCPNLPSACCFATDPQNDLAQSGGCAALVSQFDCEYDVGLHFCTWNPSCGLATPKQCCITIDPSEDEPNVGCAQMPDYGECVESLGFGYCKWDPSATCPLPPSVSCPSCADPVWINDPDVQSAYIQSFQAYFQYGCGMVIATPVPAPAGPPAASATGATTYETELGRWCGWEAAFAQLQCLPSFPVVPACPAPPKPTTCCSPVVPGIDPASPPGASCAALTAFGDCTQGVGVGVCQWNAGAQCPVPAPPSACANCMDPTYFNDPDVQAASNISFGTYLQNGCGAMIAAPVPQPSLAPSSSSSGATPYETQLGRFCGFEMAFQTAQCLPTATYAPACPSLPAPTLCCSNQTPGVQPAGTTCQALKSPSTCLAGPNAATCQWNTSPACPLPTNNSCAACADPSHYPNGTFAGAFSNAYQTYLTNGCAAMASAPVPPPSAALGTNLYELQLGRYCGFQQAVGVGACSGAVTVPVCTVDVCSQAPALCPAPVPNCSGCANLAAQAGFASVFNQTLSGIVAGGCLAAQTQGPPAINASIGAPTYVAQAATYCGYQTAMAQNCNSPGCPGTGCADCVDPQYVADPTFSAALHFGWTRYGSETCGDLAALAIPAPNQPAGTAAFKSQLGRWCAFEVALEKNGCGTSSCPGLATCTSGQTSCILPTPTCADCVAAAGNPTPAFQAAFGQATTQLGALACQQLYANTTPPVVTAGPASAAYQQQLGAWCGYQDQLEQKCGTLYSQCNVP